MLLKNANPDSITQNIVRKLKFTMIDEFITHFYAKYAEEINFFEHYYVKILHFLK
jgi:hypothetical protein